jgi:hypothetical protein
VPVCRLSRRRFAAMVNVATGTPERAWRSSGLPARPGLEQAVLRHLGAAQSQVHHLRIGPLHDRVIDEIVRGHGVVDEAFRRHVIQAASGIPLVAHSACIRMAACLSAPGWGPAGTAGVLGSSDRVGTPKASERSEARPARSDGLGFIAACPAPAC